MPERIITTDGKSFEIRPFDLDQNTQDATSPDHLLREDGRGLFLMRKLMDDVQRYDSGTGGGNVVRLTLSRA